MSKYNKPKNPRKSPTLENRLPASTPDYETILAAVPDIIMKVDVNKVYTWANQAGLDFFGADVIGKEASYFFEGEQKTYDSVKTLFEGDEKVIYIESWQRRKDQGKRLLAWWCRVIKDADGEVTGAISTARDITEQRKLEAQLQYQNQLFQNTVESLTHPFYVIDTNDFTIKMANTATAIYGRISESTTCYALTHNRKRPCRGTKHLCPLELVIQTKTPVKVEHIQYDKDGTAKNFEIHGFPILDDQGNVIQMIEYTLDITERKQAEEALLESEAKWRSLTEHSPDQIMLLDCDGKILFVNHSFSGQSRDDVIDTFFFDYSLPEHRDTIRECLKRVLRTGKPETLESSYLDTANKVHFLESYVGPVVKSDHRIGLTISSRDITARKQLQAALKQSHAELERRVEERTIALEEANKALRIEIVQHKKAEKARKVAEQKLAEQRIISMRSDRLRSLGQMAAGIAHELNQPLVGVRGLAEHLLIGLNRGWEFSEDKYREKLSLIIEQADRMSHIIDHIRLFAREAGKPELHLIQVNDVIRSAMDLLGAQFHSRGIVLELDLCQNECMILANPFSLEEVILNLLLNARDAIQEKLARDPDTLTARIIVRTSMIRLDSKTFIRIQIEDNGIGIQPDLISKVFDPFFTTKAPDKGTGLGLSISKSIIEQFNGKIDIQSVYKQGTQITITFPITNE